MADFSLQALHDEIVNDPEGAGYSGMEHATIAAAMNDPDHAILAGIVDRRHISMEDVRAAVPVGDYDKLTADRQEWLRWISGGGGSIRVNSQMKESLTKLAANGGIWHDTTVSAHTAILALIQYTGSRSEVLFGEGYSVTPSQIANALRL
jgi:hypothetical protein